MNVVDRWLLIKFVEEIEKKTAPRNPISKYFVFFQQREIDERVESERIEQIRKQIIEEERIKLLREHAHRLLGYLPKVDIRILIDNRKENPLLLQGVIRDEKDLDYLGNDFKNEFKRRQINMQNSNGWDN